MKSINLFTKEPGYEARAWMEKPFKVGKYVFATDAHTAVKIPSTLCNDIELGVPDKEKCKKLLGYFNVNQNQNLTVSVDAICTALINNSTSAETELVGDCSCCKGEGNVIWTHEFNGKEYEEEFECPKCGGVGEYYRKTGIYVPSEFFEFRVSNHFLQWRFVQRLTEVAKELNQPTVTLIHQDVCSIFKVGDARVLIMPKTGEPFSCFDLTQKMTEAI